MATPVGAGSGTWSIMGSTGLLPCQPKIVNTGSSLVLVAGGTSNGPAGGGGGTQGGGGGGINTLASVLNAMTLAHEDTPQGVPVGYSWQAGPNNGDATPGLSTPVVCAAGTYWGQVYFGSAGWGGDTNVRVQVRMVELYVHSKSHGTWTVMMQGNGLTSGFGINGGFYVEDFVNNASISPDIRDESANGGGVSAHLSRATITDVNGVEGYNFHFFGASRGSIPITASDVDAGFSTLQARLILDNPAGIDDRHLANYIVNCGFDWWTTLTAPFVADESTNPGGAQGRFRKVPTNGDWVACNAWNGPLGFVPTWPNGSAYSTGIPLTTMQNEPPPLNAMGA